MLQKNRKTLIFQMSMTIAVFIILIEGVLLVTSVYNKKNELRNLNTHIKTEMQKRYSVTVEKPLSDEYIQNRLWKFTFGVIILTLIVIAVVVIGTIYVFHRIALGPIYGLIEFYKNFDINDLRPIPAHLQPENEIGEMIDAQNRVLFELIKEQNLAEEATARLKQAARFYQHNPGPMLRVTRTGQILIANSAANKLFNKVDSVGLDIRQLCPDLANFDFDGSAGQDFAGQEEVMVLERSCLLTIVGNTSENTLIIYGTDITQRQALKSQVAQTAKLASIGQLAASVAHEINNPLAILMGNIELVENYMEMGRLNETFLQSSLAKQMKSVQRISDIVKNLRMYTRTDTEVEQFDASETLAEVRSMLQSMYNAAGIRTTFEFTAQESITEGIPGQFQQVLINLLSNAKDALEGHGAGVIAVRVFNIDDQFIIEVEDNGSGISEENMERIFESFFTTKSRTKGTGLGLDISRTIINKMGGVIEVSSTLGQGTTFVIKVPLCESVVGQKTSEQKIHLPYLDMNVMVVDDEGDICVLLNEFLEDRVNKVRIAADGRQALEILKKERIDLVLSDALMPYLDGVKLAKEIQLNGWNCKVILMTGESDPELDIGEIGVDRLLFKPFSREQVSLAIAETLKIDVVTQNKSDSDGDAA